MKHLWYGVKDSAGTYERSDYDGFFATVGEVDGEMWVGICYEDNEASFLEWEASGTIEEAKRQAEAFIQKNGAKFTQEAAARSVYAELTQWH